MSTKKTLLAITIMLFSLSFSSCDDKQGDALPQPVELKKQDATVVAGPIEDDRDPEKLKDNGNN